MAGLRAALELPLQCPYMLWVAMRTHGCVTQHVLGVVGRE